MTQTVLVAGATGMLGSRIAHHLLRQDEVEVRLLVRDGSGADPRRAAALQPLLDAGATSTAGDLAAPATLDAATRGVDVVVSAVQGSRDVVVDGQRALARAAAQNGARRFLPSDFALDVFKATRGELMSYDLRAEAGALIEATGLQTVHVLNGAFLDMFVEPRGLLELDRSSDTATYWGDGDEEWEATTVDDTARYTALAATDPELPAGKLAVAAERLSAARMIEEHERREGRRFTRVSRGSLSDLRQWAAQERETDPSSMAATVSGYLVYMLSGQTALENLQNARYPQVRPTTYADLLDDRTAA